MDRESEGTNQGTRVRSQADPGGREFPAFRRVGLPRLLLAVAITAVLVIPLVIWRVDIVVLLTDRVRAIETVRGAGIWAPLMVIGLTTVQVIAAPIPGQAINFVAGHLFGFWLGVLYSWLGTLLGSAMAMAIARFAGRPLVTRLVDPVILARLDRLASGQGLRFFFLVFLIPFLPDDLLCFVAGLTPLPLLALISVAAAGRIPGVITAVGLGSRFDAWGWQGWVGIGAVVAVGVFITWRWGEQIQQMLLNFMARGSDGANP